MMLLALDHGDSSTTFNSWAGLTTSVITGLKRPPNTATMSGMAASSVRLAMPRAGLMWLSFVTSSRGRPPSTPPAPLISSIATRMPSSMA